MLSALLLHLPGWKYHFGCFPAQSRTTFWFWNEYRKEIPKQSFQQDSGKNFANCTQKTDSMIVVKLFFSFTFVQTLKQHQPNYLVKEIYFSTVMKLKTAWLTFSLLTGGASNSGALPVDFVSLPFQFQHKLAIGPSQILFHIEEDLPEINNGHWWIIQLPLLDDFFRFLVIVVLLDLRGAMEES